MSSEAEKSRFSLSCINTKPKVLLAAAVPLFLAVVIGATAFISLIRMDKTQKWVDHSQEVVNTSAEVVTSALKMQTGMRGFMLAGKEEFLKPYEKGAQTAFDGLRTMRALIADNPAQVSRLRAAENALLEWQTESAEKKIKLRREIGHSPTMNDMADAIKKGAGKVYLDKFRSQMAAFIEAETAELQSRKASFAQLLDSGIISVSSTQDALAAFDETTKSIKTAKDVLAAAVDMETGMRGFLIAGEDRFLDPFNSGNAVFHKLVRELQETVRNKPAQVARLSEANSTIDEWLVAVVEPMIDLRRNIGDASTMDDAADLVGESHGKVLFQEFMSVMDDFGTQEQALMIERQTANNEMRFMTEVTIAVVMLVALAVGIFVAMFVGGNIGNAIKSLTDTMQKLADGDDTVEVNGQQRGDEVGAMARATEVFKQNALRVAKLNKEQEEASKKMAEMAEEREQAAQREMEEAKERERVERAAAQERSEMMDDLGNLVGAAIEGEFSSRVDARFSDQGLNDLARNINRLMEAFDSGLSETNLVLERVASGDLTKDMTGDFQGAFGRLQSNANQMISSLKELIMEISGSGNTLASSSAELRDTAVVLSTQAEENAAALEQTSAALEELSSNIKQVSGNVSEARESAHSARETARESGQVAADAAESMTRISAASKEIAQVISVINDIAFQINLLALNAGVEAARAGDAGRGFSVVASEVRQLAQRASEAAKEIDTVITRSDEAVAEGVSKVSDAQVSLEAIAEGIVAISSGVDQMSSAIEEQVCGIAEISTAVTQIDQNTQKQAASFEEVTAASTVLATEATHLTESTQSFQTGPSPNNRTAPAPTTPPKVQAQAPKVAAAGGGGAVNYDDWDEF